MHAFESKPPPLVTGGHPGHRDAGSARIVESERLVFTFARGTAERATGLQTLVTVRFEEIISP